MSAFGLLTRSEGRRPSLDVIPIHLPGTHATTPLASIATVIPTVGRAQYQRENQQTMIALTSDVSTRSLGSVMSDVRRVLAQNPPPSGVHVELAGQYANQQESFRALMIVLLLAAVSVVAIMLIQFRSFIEPLLIVLAAPVSFVGAVGLLWVTGTQLNVSSLMGLILLIGLIVKNGIILLDFTELRMRDEGETLEVAIRHAARVRLRPILMTTLCTLAGLTPLALGLGAGSELQKPLAIAVIGGLDAVDSDHALSRADVPRRGPRARIPTRPGGGGMRARFVCGRALLLGALALLTPAVSQAQLVPVTSPPKDSTKPEGLFTVSDALLFGGFLVVAGVARPLDKQIAIKMREPSAQLNKVASTAARSFNFYGSPGVAIAGVAMYGVGRIGHLDRLADLGLHSTEAIVLSAGITYLVKGIAGRERPSSAGVNEPDDFHFGADSRTPPTPRFRRGTRQRPSPPPRSSRSRPISGGRSRRGSSRRSCTARRRWSEWRGSTRTRTGRATSWWVPALAR